METQESMVEVPCSSPTGSIIEIPEKQRGIMVVADDDDDDDSDNLYSYQPVDTIFNSNSMETTQNKGAIIYEEQADDDSGLVEVSHTEFLNSQKQKIHSSPLKNERFMENDDLIVTSSSPIITQHTQPVDSMVPSAQLTSFRMQSPMKIIKRQTQTATQDSFTVPNLISPIVTPTKRNKAFNNGDSSPSIYCTAKSPSSPSPSRSSPFEIKRTNFKFKGTINKTVSPHNKYVTTRLLKRTVHMIDDSDDETDRKNDGQEIFGSGSSDDEDDSNISIIEITRTIKKPKPSVLQVVSSPGYEKSSPFTTPIQDHPELRLKGNENHSNDVNHDGNEEDENNNDEEMEQMTMDEIKKKIIQYGLKPSKSKLKMINSIKEINALLTADTLLKLSTLETSSSLKISQTLIEIDIFNKINGVIYENDEILNKILIFQPIKFTDITNWLMSNDLKINEDILRKWCDKNSICLLEEKKIENFALQVIKTYVGPFVERN